MGSVDAADDELELALPFFEVPDCGFEGKSGESIMLRRDFVVDSILYIGVVLGSRSSASLPLPGPSVIFTNLPSSSFIKPGVQPIIRDNTRE